MTLKKQKRRQFGFGTFLVLLASQLVGCIPSVDITPAQEAGEVYLEKVQSRQFDEAYKLLSPKYQATATRQDVKKAWLALEKNEGELQSWSRENAQLVNDNNGRLVVINYTLKCTNKDSNVQLVFVEEKERWNILRFSFFK